jgi:casein kinase II subunit alpha
MSTITLNHRYADANKTKPHAYWDYENYEISWGSVEPYDCTARLGRGKYSEVLEAVNTHSDERCVVKILKPVKKKKIRREARILTNLCGAPNVVKLLDMVRDDATKIPSFVFEYIPNIDFRTLYPTFSDLDIRYYIFQIIRALDFSHANGIMHRDVKPHNVMIDHSTKRLRLIDWGLAEFYHKGTEYNVRVASRYFKGPELLVDHKTYDYSLDMWSLGCMLAGMLFFRDPFFHGKDNYDQLVQIVRVLGTEKFIAYVRAFNLVIPAPCEPYIGSCHPRPFATFITPQNQHLCPPEALDFLENLLRYDPRERLDTVQAMAHRYFDPVRDAPIV